jgi:hypothetical protein
VESANRQRVTDAPETDEELRETAERLLGLASWRLTDWASEPGLDDVTSARRVAIANEIRGYSGPRDRRSKRVGTSEAFTILSRADIRALPRVSWLVAGLVQTSGLIILGGDGGIGKSAIAIDWAASVATGRAWNGRAVRLGNVLYIAGEGAEGIESRLAAWESVAGVQIPDDRMSFVAEGFNLSNERAVEYAVEQVRAREYGLIIVDTLSQLASVTSENDNAELSKVLNQAKAIRLARPGASVVVVHHTGKGGRLRGASAIRDNADSVIVARETGTNLGGFYLTTENEHDGKQKNGRAERIDGLWLDEVGGSIVVRMGGRDPLSQAILAVVADGAEHSGVEFYAACVAASVTEQKAVRRRLADLVASGNLTHNGAATTAARWQLGQPSS